MSTSDYVVFIPTPMAEDSRVMEMLAGLDVRIQDELPSPEELYPIDEMYDIQPYHIKLLSNMEKKPIEPVILNPCTNGPQPRTGKGRKRHQY